MTKYDGVERLTEFQVAFRLLMEKRLSTDFVVVT